MAVTVTPPWPSEYPYWAATALASMAKSEPALEAAAMAAESAAFCSPRLVRNQDAPSVPRPKAPITTGMRIADIIAMLPAELLRKRRRKRPAVRVNRALVSRIRGMSHHWAGSIDPAV